ncbi:hypothetical protein [Janthinobacterium violaceinigrum]|uniref:Carboxypeptidase regulatory-like domain-containing protein n=1 Tax=Janthinobacterium violaceinigrum TaxID=2654252 RepID=A0A6I1I4X5_9BURK|nr:hypothetical protein [Janthinobacterium violaceinigrum]KAB8065010.1 hypothetical protein GCN75_10185 [Janthinobacterium violaceinigrum]
MRQLLPLAAACAATLMLAACGGSSSSADPVAPVAPIPPVVPVAPPPATTLSGTAAVGAPVSGSVIAIDSKGKISVAVSTGAGGAYTLDVGGMTAPFLLSITGTAGGKQVTMNSIATAAGQTVNITPLTDLIVSAASGQPGGTALASVCAPVANTVPAACTAALASAATQQRLDAAIAAVVAMIKPINTSNTNPLTGAFVANGTGMDAVLDQILVAPAEAQGAMATVTLIATNSTLGSVTLPAAAGGASTIPAATPPSDADLAKANAAASVLPEIRACMASLSALYPKTGFVVPSAAAVSPFVDGTFNMGTAVGKAEIVSALTSTDQAAHAGLTIEALGLASVNMQPLSTDEIAALTSSTSTSTTRVADFIGNRLGAGATAIAFTAGKPSSAWVQLRIGTDAGMLNWKLVKTSDTSGCAGGWKLAGSGHLDMHMNARIQRSLDGAGTASFAREWAAHVELDTVLQENPAINKIDVRGPGLTTFGDFQTPGTAGSKLQLILPATGYTHMRIADSNGAASAFYNNAEAIQSCQDLASLPAGTPGLGAGTACIDETKAAPGKVYVWTLKTPNGAVSAFPFQINAVPLSKAFARANQASLFATITSITPAKLSSIAAATLLDGAVTFNYTQSATYGSKMDNCGLYLFNTDIPVLNAEQNAVGQETSCTFTTSGLNALASNVADPAQPGTSLFKFTGPVTAGGLWVTTIVLGNQASSGQPYPN